MSSVSTRESLPRSQSSALSIPRMSTLFLAFTSLGLIDHVLGGGARTHLARFACITRCALVKSAKFLIHSRQFNYLGEAENEMISELLTLVELMVIAGITVCIINKGKNRNLKKYESKYNSKFSSLHQLFYRKVTKQPDQGSISKESTSSHVDPVLEENTNSMFDLQKMKLNSTFDNHFAHFLAYKLKNDGTSTDEPANVDSEKVLRVEDLDVLNKIVPELTVSLPNYATGYSHDYSSCDENDEQVKIFSFLEDCKLNNKDGKQSNTEDSGFIYKSCESEEQNLSISTLENSFTSILQQYGLI